MDDILPQRKRKQREAAAGVSDFPATLFMDVDRHSGDREARERVQYAPAKLAKACLCLSQRDGCAGSRQKDQHGPSNSHHHMLTDESGPPSEIPYPTKSEGGPDSSVSM